MFIFKISTCEMKNTCKLLFLGCGWDDSYWEGGIEYFTALEKTQDA